MGLYYGAIAFRQRLEEVHIVGLCGARVIAAAHV